MKKRRALQARRSQSGLLPRSVCGGDVRQFARFSLAALRAEMCEQRVEIAAIIADHAGESGALFLREPDADDIHVENLVAAVFLDEPPVNGNRLAAIRKADLALHDGLVLATLPRAEDAQLLVIIIGEPRHIDLHDEGFDKFA